MSISTRMEKGFLLEAECSILDRYIIPGIHMTAWIDLKYIEYRRKEYKI